MFFSLIIYHFLPMIFLIQQCGSSLTTQYKDYRLYSIQMPSNYELTNEQLNEQNQLIDQPNQLTKERKSNNLFYSLMNQLNNQIPVDFWQLNINHSILTVSPQYYVQVEDYLLNNTLKFDLLDENIQNRLNQELQDVAHGEIFNVNHQNMNSTFKLDTYHPLDEINDYLRYLSKRYPETVRTNSIGKTFENRDILAITIRRKSKLKRPVMVIDAGMHPREWITQASALVLISKLVYYFNMGASHTVLDQFAFVHNNTEADSLLPIDFVIIPIINPDGYVYTWLQDRLYRKNRAVPKSQPRRMPWNFFKECVGIDLNRNFDYYFAYSAMSTNPCSDVFAGDKAFSEAESSALRTLLLSLRPDAYLSLHSFSQLITWPNEINNTKLPNHNQLKEVARKMSLAMKELEGKEYRYGQISQFNYGITGDSVGWASLSGSINLTYRIDLRDKGIFSYNIPRNQIVSNGEELLKGIMVIANEIKESFKSY